jgi:hypothetical protein
MVNERLIRQIANANPRHVKPRISIGEKIDFLETGFLLWLKA